MDKFSLQFHSNTIRVMIQMCQLLKHKTKIIAIRKFNYHDVDVVPITLIATSVCKLFISKIGDTSSNFHTLISTIVVKDNII